MRTATERIPTPQELGETLKTMTVSQKLQFESIVNAMTSLLVSVCQVKNANDHTGTEEA